MSPDHEPYETTADRLRTVLGSVAEATPTRDRSAELLARLDPVAESVDGSGPAPVPRYARESPRRRPRHRPLALVAAVVVVLGVAALAFAIVTRDGDPEVTSGPGETDTGWFLPPEGWQVTSVRTDYLDIGESGGCPCTTWVAARPGSAPASVLVGETGGPAEEVGPTEPVDVGGRPGRLSRFEPAGPGNLTVLVEAGGRGLSVTGRGVDQADLVALADAWLDQRAAGEDLDVAELPLPNGFERAEPQTTPDGRAWHLVMVTARSEATGQTVAYEFVPPDWLTSSLLAADTIEVDGETFVATGPADEPPWRMIVGGPVDLGIGQNEDGTESSPSLTPADLATFAEGLRQVSTREWRAALRTATDVDDKVLEAPTLTDPPLYVP